MASWHFPVARPYVRIMRIMALSKALYLPETWVSQFGNEIGADLDPDGTFYHAMR